MPRQSYASRQVATLTLAFGDLNVPVVVYRAATTTALRAVPCNITERGDLSPVDFCAVDQEGNPVEAENFADLVPAVLLDGAPLPLDEGAIRQALNFGAATRINYFVNAACARDTYTVVNRYLVRSPQTRNSTRARAEQTALRTVLDALAAEHAVALLTTTFEGTPRPAMLAADGTLSTLHYAHEATADIPLPDAERLDDPVALRARMVVARDMTNVALPLVDTAGEAVRDYLAEQPDFSESTPPVIPQTREEIAEILLATAAVTTATPEPAPRRRRGVTIADAIRVTEGFAGNTISSSVFYNTSINAPATWAWSTTVSAV